MGLRDRTALLFAASKFLADGTTAASIQQITDAADVCFGMDSAEAEELSARPLPEVPELAVDGGHR